MRHVRAVWCCSAALTAGWCRQAPAIPKGQHASSPACYCMLLANTGWQVDTPYNCGHGAANILHIASPALFGSSPNLARPPPPHAAHPMAPLWPVNKEARALPRASSVGHWLDSVSRGGKSAAHVACRCEELVATACSGAELGGSGHTRPPSAVPLRPAVALSTNAHTCLPRASAACALHGALGHAAAVPTAGPCSSGAARSAVRPEALAHDAWSMVNHAQAVGCTVCW